MWHIIKKVPTFIKVDLFYIAFMVLFGTAIFCTVKLFLKEYGQTPKPEVTGLTVTINQCTRQKLFNSCMMVLPDTSSVDPSHSISACDDYAINAAIVDKDLVKKEDLPCTVTMELGG